MHYSESSDSESSDSESSDSESSDSEILPICLYSISIDYNDFFNGSINEHSFNEDTFYTTSRKKAMENIVEFFKDNPIISKIIINSKVYNIDSTALFYKGTKRKQELKRIEEILNSSTLNSNSD